MLHGMSCSSLQACLPLSLFSWKKKIILVQIKVCNVVIHLRSSWSDSELKGVFCNLYGEIEIGKNFQNLDRNWMVTRPYRLGVISSIFHFQGFLPLKNVFPVTAKSDQKSVFKLNWTQKKREEGNASASSWCPSQCLSSCCHAPGRVNKVRKEKKWWERGEDRALISRQVHTVTLISWKTD